MANLTIQQREQQAGNVKDLIYAYLQEQNAPSGALDNSLTPHKTLGSGAFGINPAFIRDLVTALIGTQRREFLTKNTISNILSKLELHWALAEKPGTRSEDCAAGYVKDALTDYLYTEDPHTTEIKGQITHILSLCIIHLLPLNTWGRVTEKQIQDSMPKLQTYLIDCLEDIYDNREANILVLSDIPKILEYIRIEILINPLLITLIQSRALITN